MNKKKKIFTFKYDPTISLKRMGEEILTAVKTDKPQVHLHEISFNNLEDIMNEAVSPRPKLFACLVEKKPESLYQLAKILNRNYANVYKDVQNLVAMGVIRLEKVKKGKGGERIRPVPLYDEIAFDFNEWRKREPLRGRFEIKPFNFLEKIKILQTTRGRSGIEYKIYDNNK
jgi:predicted transcriptional regulator